MFLIRSINLIVFVIIFLNFYVDSTFGSLAVNSSQDNVVDAKENHIKNIAVHSGNLEYFLLHHRKELLTLPEKRLSFLERKKYFGGTLRFKDDQGVSVLGPDGNVMVGNCPLPEHQKSEVSFWHYGKRLKLFPAAFVYYSSVTSITLCYNGIVALPDEIYFLRRLRILDLSYNRLSILPNHFRLLKTMETLNLEGNEIRDFPDVICDLERMTTLNLGFNRLREIPGELFCLESLRYLNLSGNKFSQLPESIGMCPSILTISLRANKLFDVPLQCLRLKTLTHLDLSNNEILLAIVGAVDEYEALKAKAANCLISISGNINAESQAEELIRIWHENNRPRIQEATSALQRA